MGARSSLFVGDGAFMNQPSINIPKPKVQEFGKAFRAMRLIAFCFAFLGRPQKQAPKRDFSPPRAMARFLQGDDRNQKKGPPMLGWTMMLLVIALVAGLLGFTSVAGAAATIAKFLFVIFLVLFLASFVSHLLRPR